MGILQEIQQYIVENILFGDGEVLKEDTSFQEHGIIDSLGFVELISFVEEKYTIKIKDEELIPENFDNLLKVTRFVEEKLNKKSALET